MNAIDLIPGENDWFKANRLTKKSLYEKVSFEEYIEAAALRKGAVKSSESLLTYKLKYVEGLTAEQVANLLGIAKGTVFTRLNVAKVILARAYEAKQQKILLSEEVR